MAKLTGNTIVSHPETGVPTVLLKDSDVPDWADGLIGDHLLEGGSEEVDLDAVPPTSGKGSGVQAWQADADHKGIAYPEGASRDEIIAAVEAHTEQ